MRKRVIPKRNGDLRAYVLRRKWMQVVAYLVWIAVFLAGALVYNAAHQTYPPEKLMLGWRLLLWMLISAASGFFLFRIYRLLTDRTFEGRVERSGLSHTYTSSADPGGANAISYDFRLHTYLVIRTDSGKKKRIRFEQKPGFYLYYYEGSYLCHLSGLPYPVCDPSRACRPEKRKRRGVEERMDDPSEGYVCAACGFMNKSLDEPCDRCGHSLIDPSELWSERTERDG